MIDLKCIKEKCYYCKEHDFYSTYYNCRLADYSFKKDADIPCEIMNEIKRKTLALDELKDLRMFILVNQ